MDIILAVVGNVIVDDHLDVVDIDPAGQDIRGHQDRQSLASEFQQDLLTLRLLQITMDLLDIELRAFKLYG
jgi:hypothetical protein